MSVSEELARLAQLRDQGVLSEDEFQAQKAVILQGAPPPATESAPKPKTSKFATGCGAIVVILVILFVIGVIASPETGDTAKSDPATPATPPVEVTAADLFRAYEANEAAAQQSYGDRPLLVSGTIDSITLGFSDEPRVLLRTPNQFQSAQAELTKASQAQASSLSKGASIRLLCQGVSEVIGTPMLKDCEIQ